MVRRSGQRGYPVCGGQDPESVLFWVRRSLEVAKRQRELETETLQCHALAMSQVWRHRLSRKGLFEELDGGYGILRLQPGSALQGTPRQSLHGTPIIGGIIFDMGATGFGPKRPEVSKVSKPTKKLSMGATGFDGVRGLRGRQAEPRSTTLVKQGRQKNKRQLRTGKRGLAAVRGAGQIPDGPDRCGLTKERMRSVPAPGAGIRCRSLAEPNGFAKCTGRGDT